MAFFNLAPSSPSTFILKGIPGLEDAHIWISITFCVVYIINLLGNFTVMFVVVREKTLHKPMYLLLCILAITDIGIATCIVPKALGIFWFGFKEITVDGCLTQMFFFHTVGAMHSAVLVTMAFDRYVAISDPLRYSTILTSVRTAKLVLLGLIRAVLLALPGTLIIWRLPFCDNHVILHTYCGNMAVMKMPCGDTSIYQRHSLVITLMITGVDLTLMGLSYGLIIRAVLRIKSKKAHQKAFSTCIAHICVTVIAHISSFFSSMTHRFGQGIGAHIHILLANVPVLVPPMLNPIIYGIKTKDLCDKLRKYTSRM